MLLENKAVARSFAAVTAISPKRLVVFGGESRENKNFGYILNLDTKLIKPIQKNEKELKISG